MNEFRTMKLDYQTCSLVCVAVCICLLGSTSGSNHESGDARAALGSAHIGGSSRNKREAGSTTENETESPESNQSNDQTTENNLITIGKDSQLHKLMSESSELAQELTHVFDFLSNRENQLVKEMDSLKSALGEAISTLKDHGSTVSMVNLKRARRAHDDDVVNDSEGLPYKACVSIEEDEDGGDDYGDDGDGEDQEQEYPPNPDIREFIPDENANTGEVKKSSNGQTTYKIPKAETDEAIDLSKVYWLRLPNTIDDETVASKVRTVFSEVTHNGKDALIIPVPRGFKSRYQLSQKFLKAVQIKPGSKRLKIHVPDKLSRKIRSLSNSNVNFQIKQVV